MDDTRYFGQAHPSSAGLSFEESHNELMSEIKLLETQQHLKNEARQRGDAFDMVMESRRLHFERRQWEKRRDFEQSEHEKRTSMATTLLQQCETHGIAETRKRVVPAYTLTRFSNLPMEVQLRIWSMAARTRSPRIFPMIKRRDDEEWDGARGSYRRYKGSSRIYKTNTPFEITYELVILGVCKTSHMVALKVYTLLQKKLYNSKLASASYYATLYDKFYMGGLWHQHKVLLDLMIRRHTTRPLSQHVQADLARLQGIKHFVIDLSIFAGVPVDLWAEFQNLESLTISIYPEKAANTLRFVRPRKGTKLGKRAGWVLRKALLSFEGVKSNHINPDWRIPKVEVVAQYSSTEADCEIEEDVSDDESCHAPADMTIIEQSSAHGGGLDEDRETTTIEEGAIQIGDDEDYPEMDGPEDDSLWYQETEAKMTHTVPPERLRKLKHRHHPSRRNAVVDWLERQDAGREKKWGGWWTDSETEFMDENRYYDGFYNDTKTDDDEL